MQIRTAQEIMQELEMTRQEIGSISMIIDGAQTHIIIESLLEALKHVTELLIVSKKTEPEDWPGTFGTQEDNIKSTREIGITTLSTFKIFMDSLPDNLKKFDKAFTPETLNLIENFFKEENYD